VKIAFVSTRGIPNNYGGLEEFAEHVSVGLVKKGHDVIVYNPNSHPYDKEKFFGVRIKKKFSPEKKIGTAANFIYDYLSLRDALREKCDVILICGYTTASISFYVCPFKNSKIITNIDGLEWKRSKWSPAIQRLTRWFEKIAIEKSHALVADNIGIEKYLDENFSKPSYFIPYAANILASNESVLDKYNLQKYSYHVMIGRLEPENNIEMILDGVVFSASEIPCVVFANYKTKYGQFLVEKYKNCKKIIFSGWASGQETLYQLRHFAKIYFHGHSVGGTNPSLLEAMAAETYIAAHDNIFNKNVLGADALYIASASDVKNIIDGFDNHSSQRLSFEANNLQKIKTFYNWENITNMYEKMFLELINKQK
jgi:glycosyltransferase involved in cell wall biosynthesis